MPYLRDDRGEIYCLDSEGAPLKIHKKKEILESQLVEGELVKADYVKSPMPGTVVKIYCQVG